MIPLITLSHGSRKPSAAAGITNLTNSAGEVLGVMAVEAHLDLSEPSLDAVVEDLAALGVNRAALVPLLFTNAFHNKVDVPAAVRDAQNNHGVELLVGPHLGTGSDVADLLVAVLERDAHPEAHVVLYSVGSSHVEANEAVVDLADTVARASGHGVEVVPATGGPGSGGAGVMEVAAGHRRLHLLPLFVTEGLLLDRVVENSRNISAATGCTITHSSPLTTALTPLVVARYRAALSGLLAQI
ncbi:sirohydrochlorin chelatase [Corynebacterium pacaense]|uniref:sirohydrochlorin chelatase n=1 Tax=Corynebacterium pacaense TaxID=1816684 RepID=UPI0009BB5516|nr:sirohydrochlorin chelatase [Corynebacterium pacaense]